MSNFIIGFRESIEAILLIILILGVLKETNRLDLRKSLFAGALVGIVISLLLGIGIFYVTKDLGDVLAKVWEVFASLAASILVVTLVFFMIRNGKNIVNNVQEKTKNNLGGIGIFFLSLFMVAREGFEIVLFVVANPNNNNIILLTTSGIILGIFLGMLLYFSIIKINLKILFKITLFYLILQAGYLLGYSVHEFIEILEIKGIALDSQIIHGRLYDLSSTFLNHDDSPIGLFLNVVFGWYSKPHILQFIAQYAVTIFLFLSYRKYNKPIES